MSVLEELEQASRANLVQHVEAGKTFYLRVLTGEERDRWDAYIRAIDENKGEHSEVYAALLAVALADAQGQRAFADGDAGEIRQKTSAKLLKALFDKALEHNRLGPEGAAEAKNSSASIPPATGG